MKEEFINEMTTEAKRIINEVAEDFFDSELLGSDYDRGRTSYVITLRLFGFDFNIVYVFDEQKVYLFDVEKNRDILVADDNTDMFEFCNGVKMYSWLLHAADSTCCFDVL